MSVLAGMCGATVGSFPLRASDAEPAKVDPAGGDRSKRSDRQIAAVAWAAALQHGYVAGGFPASSGTGLRGGTYTRTFDDSGVTLQLAGVRFASDVAVSGSETISFGGGTIDATLDVTGPNGTTGQLHVTGVVFPHTTPLQVRGTIAGRAVSALVLSA
jgi:hypothetical protein